MAVTPLHIVLGDSAGGSLKHACSTLGLPGNVIAIPDELSHGPLHDGRARAAYFRECIYGRYADVGIPNDVFEEWHRLLRLIEEERPPVVVAWSSDAISDMIFLRMACWWLRGFAGSIESVNTSEGGRHGVGVNGPERLRGLYDARIALDTATRQALAAEFAEMRDRCELLRVHRDGKIDFVATDHFDAYVMSFASREWLPAIRLIGNCLGHRDDQNLIGDSFFEWRLQQLIDSGLLDAEGDRSHMRGYRVRQRKAPAIR